MKKRKLVPDSVKGTGFYVPMDLAPDEFGSVVDYQRLKETILYALEEDWGPRCKTKDTDDFPEIFPVGDPDMGRCPVCLVYEKFDDFWRIFNHVDMEMP